ncbi:MAG: hypothetical protein V3576_02335 [Candidatus Cloacimonadota bacterium]
MKRIVLTVCLIALAAALAAGNSIFAYDGYPVQFYGRDIYSMGMGETGSSDVFRVNNGYANPALSADSNLSLFSTGLILGWTQYKSETAAQGEQSFTDNSLDLPYFSMSIPYRKHRFGFQFNSFASGLVSNETSWEDSASGLSITEQQEMDRYIYRADLIYSYKLRNLSLGLSGNFYFGHETHSFIQESGSGIFDVREQLIRKYKNPTATFGTIYRLPKLAFGAYYTLPVTLKGDLVRTSIHEVEDPVDYEQDLPAQLSASVTALPSRTLKIAADMVYEDWTAIRSNGVQSLKLGLGLAYEPVREEYETGLGKIPLRAGLSWRKLGFKSAEGNEINELSLSTGVSFNLARLANRLDLGFQYTRRGDLTENGLMDSSFMLMLGMTGFDILTKAPDRKAPREIPLAEEI